MVLLGKKPMTLIRRGQDVHMPDGSTVPGAEVTSIIKASVQPLRGKELEVLEEGDRHDDWRKLYTRTSLHSADQHAGTSGDLIEYKGVRYRVRLVEPYEDGLIKHNRAYIQRVKE